MFGKCKNIENILNYFKDILCKICNIVNMDIKKMLYLDFKSKNKKQRNTAIVLTVQYISTVWYNRERNVPLEILFKANIIKHHRLLKSVLQNKLSNLFTKNYCRLEKFI